MPPIPLVNLSFSEHNTEVTRVGYDRNNHKIYKNLSGYSDLPPEILEIIFKNLGDNSSLFYCMGTCRSWRAIIKDQFTDQITEFYLKKIMNKTERFYIQPHNDISSVYRAQAYIQLGMKNQADSLINQLPNGPWLVDLLLEYVEKWPSRESILKTYRAISHYHRTFKDDKKNKMYNLFKIALSYNVQIATTIYERELHEQHPYRDDHHNLACCSLALYHAQNNKAQALLYTKRIEEMFGNYNIYYYLALIVIFYNHPQTSDDLLKEIEDNLLKIIENRLKYENEDNIFWKTKIKDIGFYHEEKYIFHLLIGSLCSLRRFAEARRFLQNIHNPKLLASMNIYINTAEGSQMPKFTMAKHQIHQLMHIGKQNPSLVPRIEILFNELHSQKFAPKKELSRAIAYINPTEQNLKRAFDQANSLSYVLSLGLLDKTQYGLNLAIKQAQSFSRSISQNTRIRDLFAIAEIYPTIPNIQRVEKEISSLKASGYISCLSILAKRISKIQSKKNDQGWVLEVIRHASLPKQNNASCAQRDLRSSKTLQTIHVPFVSDSKHQYQLYEKELASNKPIFFID